MSPKKRIYIHLHTTVEMTCHSIKPTGTHYW